MASGVAAGVGLAFSAALLERRRGADLSGQTVLITGGSRGLGLELAREFAAQGCRTPYARAMPRFGESRSRSPDRGLRPCNRTQIDSMIAAVNHWFGGVDVLVNNADIIQVGSLESMTVADFENAMAVMLRGMLRRRLPFAEAVLERAHSANATCPGQ